MISTKRTLSLLAVLAAFITFTLFGCAVDATDPTPTDPASVTAPPTDTAGSVTVRRYELHGNEPATFKDYVLPLSMEPLKPGEMRTMSAIAFDPCYMVAGWGLTMPNKYSTDLSIFHDNGPSYTTSTMVSCITGTGTLDLTTAYYADPFYCYFGPNINACINNLRISGNVRGVSNFNAGSSLCYFEDGTSAYFFSTYPSTSWGPSMNFYLSGGVVNSIRVTCI